MDVNEVSDQITTFLSSMSAWAAIALPNLLGALVILVVGWWLAGRASVLVSAVLDRQTRIDPTVRSVAASVVRYAILILVIVAVLGQVGIQTTSILAALGAAGLAIGLALQGTLSNIASGLMLLWLRPFKVGDYIDTGTVAGTVKDVGLFNCEIHSWDGIYQFVPNSEIWNRRIINFTRLPTRLVDLSFSIAYVDDPAKAREILLSLATADPLAMKEPEPLTFVDELGDSAVILRLRVWAATGDYWTLRRRLTENGKAALEAAGMTIPFPQQDVHFIQAPGAMRGT